MDLFEKFTPKFDDYILESENKTESMKNYMSYIQGKEPLKVAFLTHKEGDSAYEFVKSQIKRDYWTVPRDKWNDILRKHRQDLAEVLKKRGEL